MFPHSIDCSNPAKITTGNYASSSLLEKTKLLLEGKQFYKLRQFRQTTRYVPLLSWNPTEYFVMSSIPATYMNMIYISK